MAPAVSNIPFETDEKRLRIEEGTEGFSDVHSYFQCLPRPGLLYKGSLISLSIFQKLPLGITNLSRSAQDE